MGANNIFSFTLACQDPLTIVLSLQFEDKTQGKGNNEGVPLYVKIKDSGDIKIRAYHSHSQLYILSIYHNT